MMRFNISWTWGEWWPLFIERDDYTSIGFGPLYVEIYCGSGLAPWEE